MKKNSNDSDSLLIEKAKEGNEGVFNFLMNNYFPLLNQKKILKILHNKLS